MQLNFLNFLFLFIITTCLFNCGETDKGPLPIIGNRDVVNGDTIYPKIPDFGFVNQDSQLITNATFEGKAYIADFFFIHCPTICPKVKKQMLRVQERFMNESDLMLLSHSIDVKNDTVAALKVFANKLNIKSEKWHLVTGSEEEIYGIADDYFSVAQKDPDAPGGFDHSGRLILVDKNRHVRAFCNGTDPEEVDEFMLDVDRLLLEMHKK